MAKEKKQTHTDVNQQTNSNSFEIVKREDIENSPFTITISEQHGFVLNIGDNILTPVIPIERKEEIIKSVNNRTWDRIFDLINATITFREKHKKDIEKIQKGELTKQ